MFSVMVIWALLYLFYCALGKLDLSLWKAVQWLNLWQYPPSSQSLFSQSGTKHESILFVSITFEFYFTGNWFAIITLLSSSFPPCGTIPGNTLCCFITPNVQLHLVSKLYAQMWGEGKCHYMIKSLHKSFWFISWPCYVLRSVVMLRIVIFQCRSHGCCYKSLLDALNKYTVKACVLILMKLRREWYPWV